MKIFSFDFNASENQFVDGIIKLKHKPLLKRQSIRPDSHCQLPILTV